MVNPDVNDHAEKSAAVKGVSEHASMALANFVESAFNEGYSMLDVREMLRYATQAINDNMPQ